MEEEKGAKSSAGDRRRLFEPLCKRDWTWNRRRVNSFEPPCRQDWTWKKKEVETRRRVMDGDNATAAIGTRCRATHWMTRLTMWPATSSCDQLPRRCWRSARELQRPWTSYAVPRQRFQLYLSPNCAFFKIGQYSESANLHIYSFQLTWSNYSVLICNLFRFLSAVAL